MVGMCDEVTTVGRAEGPHCIRSVASEYLTLPPEGLRVPGGASVEGYSGLV